MNSGGCTDIPGIDDAAEYSTVDKAMTVIGLTASERDLIKVLLAAILHLGNVEIGESDGKAFVKSLETLKQVSYTSKMLQR